MRTPEGRLKDAVRTELARRGFWQAGKPEPAVVNGWYYMPAANGYGVVGIPDFVGCRRGTMFAIEAKAPGKTSTRNQTKRQGEMRAGGAMVLEADSMEAVIPFLDALDKVEGNEAGIEEEAGGTLGPDDDGQTGRESPRRGDGEPAGRLRRQ